MLDKSRIVVILQARTTSERLPSKVILPLAGFPLACLAAMRASNSGLNVIVATSSDNSDDPLVNELKKTNIKYVRGSLKNVFERFDQTLQTYSEEAIVVRLTGDNVFPDGDFIEFGVNEFLKRKVSYLRSDMSYMPYGLSIEIFTKKAFLEAKKLDLTDFDKEHVTPPIKKLFGDELFKGNLWEGRNLRCTIDYPKDFEVISKVFEKISEPVQVSAQELIKTLKRLKVCLGTVQLGLAYGINNIIGQPRLENSHEILELAFDSGIKTLDTARAYGTSESIIGRFCSPDKISFDIVTKLSPDLDESSESAFVRSVKASLEKSLAELDGNQIDTILFHRFDQSVLFEGIAVKTLLEFKQAGLIRKLGVSVSSPEELKKCLEFDWIQHIQLPFNILDHRWENLEHQILKSNSKITFHTRSTFLQGLILLETKAKWPVNSLNSFDQVKDFISLLENRFSMDIKSIALAYNMRKSWIDAVVVGVESEEQLSDILQRMDSEIRLTEEDMSFIEKHRPGLDNKLLDPSQWRFE